MIIFPNGKINLGLNIVDRLPNGYHKIESIFYPVNIFDALEINLSHEFKFNNYGLNIPGNQQSNLCIKLWDLLKSEGYDLKPIEIGLLKNIPTGAGLGGGSSDCAFFIKQLNEFFELNISSVKMREYTSSLGSDCAFFLDNKPVFVYGTGSEFKPIDLNLSQYFIIVVSPPIHVSTAAAYRNVKPLHHEISVKDVINLPVTEWRDLLKNDFEPTVFKLFPKLHAIKEYLYESGAVYASMSGSGSSIYAFFSEEIKLSALEVQNRVFYGV